MEPEDQLPHVQEPTTGL